MAKSRILIRIRQKRVLCHGGGWQLIRSRCWLEARMCSISIFSVYIQLLWHSTDSIRQNKRVSGCTLAAYSNQALTLLLHRPSALSSRTSTFNPLTKKRDLILIPSILSTIFRGCSRNLIALNLLVIIPFLWTVTLCFQSAWIWPSAMT